MDVGVVRFPKTVPTEMVKVEDEDVGFGDRVSDLPEGSSRQWTLFPFSMSLTWVVDFFRISPKTEGC